MALPSKFSEDAGLKNLLSGASVALFLKIFGTCLTFLFTLLLSRFYGAEETGLFFICLAFVEVLSMISKLGLAQSSIAFIGRYSDRDDWTSVNGVFRKSLLYASSAGILLGIMLFMLSPILASRVFFDERLINLFRIIAFAIMPVALMHIVGMSLQGLRYMLESQFVIHCCEQLCLLVGIIIVMNYYSVSAVVVIYVIGAWLTVGIGFIFWRRRTCQFWKVSDIHSLIVCSLLQGLSYNTDGCFSLT